MKEDLEKNDQATEKLFRQLNTSKRRSGNRILKLNLHVKSETDEPNYQEAENNSIIPNDKNPHTGSFNLHVAFVTSFCNKR